MRNVTNAAVLAGALAVAQIAGPASGHDVQQGPTAGVAPAIDIVSAGARAVGGTLNFDMTVLGTAGAERPASIGRVPGAPVLAYVWPTTLDASAAGFAPKAGILALAVTAHPDFDDTPLFDESRDGDPGNDGAEWHSHWVVLVHDEACGAAGLKVADVAPGVAVQRPLTAAPFPLLLDSPGFSPLMSGPKLAVRVPVLEGAPGAGFDAVTASLAVNADGKAPLLCVTEVHDVASGDLSLPGRIETGE